MIFNIKLKDGDPIYNSISAELEARLQEIFNTKGCFSIVSCLPERIPA